MEPPSLILKKYTALVEGILHTLHAMYKSLEIPGVSMSLEEDLEYNLGA